MVNGEDKCKPNTQIYKLNNFYSTSADDKTRKTIRLSTEKEAVRLDVICQTLTIIIIRRFHNTDHFQRNLQSSQIVSYSLSVPE